MTVAVSVLLFLISAVWLVAALADRDLPAFLLMLATVACGVLNIALPLVGIHIMVGVVMCVYGIASIVLFVYVLNEAGGGPNSGLGALLAILSFLLMAWVITFAVLQLTIVV